MHNERNMKRKATKAKGRALSKKQRSPNTGQNAHTLHITLEATTNIEDPIAEHALDAPTPPTLPEEVILRILRFIPLYNQNVRRALSRLWKDDLRYRILKVLRKFGLGKEFLEALHAEVGVTSGSQALSMALGIDPFHDGDLDVYFMYRGCNGWSRSQGQRKTRGRETRQGNKARDKGQGKE
ncbi:hypothetical protein BGZ46_005964 [Entomortierella lignicola]|nr:hypothetical protein BGZ46_005964 [Entomortierella lignicola]